MFGVWQTRVAHASADEGGTQLEDGSSFASLDPLFPSMPKAYCIGKAIYSAAGRKLGEIFVLAPNHSSWIVVCQFRFRSAQTDYLHILWAGKADFSPSSGLKNYVIDMVLVGLS